MLFKEWLLNETQLARLGYIIACEGRRDPEVLRNRKETTSKSLFGDTKDDVRYTPDLEDPASRGGTCSITPLSGYETHIKAIQNFAFQSPENFAQTLMFSPLSANVGFAKHWDNFNVLMMILRQYYPDRVTKKEIEHVADSFGDYLYSMPMTIGGFKLNTISHIWSNKEKLMTKLSSIAKKGDDEALIHELITIPGVQSVKAGFITQLLWGRAGCLDTHNIDIYSKAFPDMKDQLNPKSWKGKKAVGNYVKTLRGLEEKGIGTKQLWDVWVDFVEQFYKVVSKTGLGSYTDMGSAIDKPDEYGDLQGLQIPKIGATTGGKLKHIPVIGKGGMGASATHLQQLPDEALQQFDKMYRRGEVGSDAARAVPFRRHKATGMPAAKELGLGTEPALLKYFEPALASGQVDPLIVRRIIKDRLEKGGKKARRARAMQRQHGLFPDA